MLCVSSYLADTCPASRSNLKLENEMLQASNEGFSYELQDRKVRLLRRLGTKMALTSMVRLIRQWNLAATRSLLQPLIHKAAVFVISNDVTLTQCLILSPKLVGGRFEAGFDSTR